MSSPTKSYILRNPHLKSSDPLFSTPYEGYNTLSAVFDRSVEKYPDRPALGRRYLNKLHVKNVKVDDKGTTKRFEYPDLTKVKYKTFSEVAELVSNVSVNLLNYAGVKKGDKLGIYLDTSMEWQLCAQSCFRYGVILCTCYANLGEEALVHVVNECELSTMIVGSKNVKNLERLKDKMPTLKKLVIVRDLTDEGELKSSEFEYVAFDDLMKNSGVAIPERPDIDPEDTCVIMYTSGSTGTPKGVVVPNRALLSSAGAVSEVVGIHKDDVYVAFLPLAHILELAAENAFLLRGGCIGYGTARTLTSKGVVGKGDIEAVAPTKMAGVPRVWSTIMKGALEQVQSGSFLKRWLFNTAMNQKQAALKNGQNTPFWNWLIFSKLREKVGGRLEVMVSGGAPMSADVQEFLHTAFCCDVVQGYGLTESCGAGAIQERGQGLVTNNIGPPTRADEIMLVSVPDLGYDAEANPPEGEVWMRGPCINKGYYKQEEKTKEAFTEDGWFKTGDIGRFNKDGTVSIIDRKKNLIKLAHGEYVAVEALEMLYGDSPFIAPGGICVYADSFHENCVAIVLPQESYVKTWAEKNNMGNKPYSSILESEELKTAILESLKKISIEHKKKKFERVADLVVKNDEWNPENQMTTASFKLRRNNIAEKYKQDIDDMYANLGDN